jgi:Tol biopolymer transport system component
MLRRFVLLAFTPAVLAAQSARPAPANTGGALPVVSPDGQYVAYNATRDRAQGDTYVMKADGTGEVQLTRTTSYEGAPVWFGKQVLTYSGTFGPTSGATALIAINPDGSGAKTIATIDGREFKPSPDGKRVAYSSGPWQSAKMYVANIDGSNAQAITDGSKMIFNAVWSPDGKRLAVAITDSSRDMQVGVMNADGSSLRVLTKFSKDDGNPQWPSWSPDGKTLAVQAGKYSRNQPENTAHIWLVDVASGRATKLAAHDANYLDETPSWFPDGKRIAFQSNRTGVMHVWVMNADGTGARQLTSWRP